MKYKFYFNDIGDSAIFRDSAVNLAEACGYITVADLYDLVNEPIDYLSNQIGWDKDTFINDLLIKFDRRSGRYIATTPEPHIGITGCPPIGDKHIYVSNMKTATPTPEPLNISITMDPSKDPYTTIREVIQQANEIKDRPVFITIN